MTKSAGDARNRKLSTLLAAVVAAGAMVVPASPAMADLPIRSFDGGAFAADNSTQTQAGSHPDIASTTFTTDTVIAGGREYPPEQLKDVIVDLPPGLVGNPQVAVKCKESELSTSGCPSSSRVGTLILHQVGGQSTTPGIPKFATIGLFNMVPPDGRAAMLGWIFSNAAFHIIADLRHDSTVAGGYTVRVSSLNAAQTIDVSGVTVDIWGVPAVQNPGPDPRAFFTLPTSCEGPGPNNSVRTDLILTSWAGSIDTASFFSHDDLGNPLGITDCVRVPFNPSLTARPTTNVAGSPTGLDVDLHIPQDNFTDPVGPVSAHLRDTTVTLPEGLVVNPSGANGLDGCSPAEVDLDGGDPANCPAASKLATVTVDTPLLDHPVPGAAYIADPFDNPFNSLLAMYIAIDDPISGTVVKIPGEIRANPVTGQLSATFEENPQVPFEDFRLDFFGGANASLTTPATCGTYTTESSLTPWSFPDSGPPATPSDAWQITQGPGGACANTPAEQPNAPSFDAGTVSPIAGAHSPFVVKLRRGDGSQQFSALTVKPPQGLVAKLAGTAICSDAALAAAAAKSGNAEKASPSCPAASEVGNVTAGAGSGPAPYYAPGKAYMSGPYKGAPLSLAIVTPATAGPFDLGTIVVKTALHVDPKTAEITAVSDPIPSILQGIPLDVKSVDVALDKPQFALNPTSCNPMAVTGQLTSLLGQVAGLEARFQLGECDRLGFKPKLALRLKGGTARGKHPQLTAYVIPREGDANIAAVSTAFPRSEFLENAHFRTICTRPDFAAGNCPAGAAYGTSTVFTPLLDYPLTGNVYLRSSDNLLPDVVPDLRGPAWQPIRVEAAGRVDSIRGGIRTTFDFFPDAPFTRAVLKMQGGDKGLLVNSRNICARTYRAVVKFTAHNGARHTIRPKLVSKSCKKNKRRKAKRNGHKRGGKRVALSARASLR